MSPVDGAGRSGAIRLANALGRIPGPAGERARRGTCCSSPREPSITSRTSPTISPCGLSSTARGGARC